VYWTGYGVFSSATGGSGYFCFVLIFFASVLFCDCPLLQLEFNMKKSTITKKRRFFISFILVQINEIWSPIDCQAQDRPVVLTNY
jgi:ATP/ADP translocase